ncbi:MAG: phosphate signaling complex protein PhoU [Pirellulaceae bacterium]|nr:phosphate signaling complex protein PhoU [Pirellulaceae bacterium]
MKKMDHDLSVLRQQVIDMGNLTEQMVLQAIDAISGADNEEMTGRVLSEEVRLDQMQLEIDKEAVRLLTLYSPVAGDLRLILSITRITAELERIGDHAVNMCESLQLMVTKNQLQLMPEIHKMGNVVKTMISDALNSFVQGDILKAKATIASDNMVDALNDQVVGELLSLEVVREILKGPSEVAGALAQVLIARSLERIADQATNISEEVVYMVQGDDIRHQP